MNFPIQLSIFIYHLRQSAQITFILSVIFSCLFNHLLCNRKLNFNWLTNSNYGFNLNAQYYVNLVYVFLCVCVEAAKIQQHSLKAYSNIQSNSSFTNAQLRNIPLRKILRNTAVLFQPSIHYEYFSCSFN